MDPELDLDRLNELMARARRERANAAAALAASAGRAAGRAFRGAPRHARRLLAELLRRRERRAMIRELQGLDDRALKDIGLYRGDIWSAAERATRDEPPRRSAPALAAERRPANENRPALPAALFAGGRA